MSAGGRNRSDFAIRGATFRRVAVRRSSADVSVAYLGVLFVGFVLWLSYGVAIGNAPLIVSNVVALTTNVLTIAAVLRFRAV